VSEAPVIFDLRGKRIFVAGHAGMAGSAIVRRLEREDCHIVVASRRELDLRNSDAVDRFMARAKPDAVVVAAGKVGGIRANSAYPAEFIADNLAISLNMIRAAHDYGVKKLLYLGSSCIYPREAPQPMQPEALLLGPLEPTNQWYAVAKIAGIKMCQAYRRQYGCDFISAMPTNLYGPGDNYDLQQGHVVAALQVKIHRAKQSGAPSVELWGTGTPRREFLYVDDLADALVFMVKHYSEESHLNIGTGVDLTIRELAELIAKIAQYRGGFVYDRSKPDGTPRKVMDVARLAALGWVAATPLEQGLRQAYEMYARGFRAQQEA